MDTPSHTSRNELDVASSLYLRQHAANPVHWQMWSDAAWERARLQHKPVLISIGYSACHWCHVMEHESFEDAEVAALMNERFVCIKVDREERPDVDHVYMQAAQLMTGSGGWPLNCFCLPDGSPFYVGTYFPRERWIHVLEALSRAFTHEHDRVLQSAAQAVNILRQTEPLSSGDVDLSSLRTDLHESVLRWTYRFDERYGGERRAPKFPMPDTYRFMLLYATMLRSQRETVPDADASVDLRSTLLEHTERTLHCMALGGINDQLAGGFSRYSVDVRWKVPHFEKMLYDNALLVSAYADAFLLTGKQFYRSVVESTLSFVEAELLLPNGCFASAIDADSTGEEGAYYTWTLEELRACCDEDYDTFCAWYSINPSEVLENGSYVLHRTLSDELIAHHEGLRVDDVRSIRTRCLNNLRTLRIARAAPQRDDKNIVAWNAYMISAYCDAYRATSRDEYLQIAVRCAEVIRQQCITRDGALLHCVQYRASRERDDVITGFLDDYASFAHACIQLYEHSSDESWLQTAEQLIVYVLGHFDTPDHVLFQFTSHKGEQLVASTIEIHDTVVPSSNAMMAEVLLDLGALLSSESYTQRAKAMLAQVSATIIKEPAYMSRWASVLLRTLYHHYQIVVVGSDAERLARELMQHYLPHCLVSWTRSNSHLPLMRDKQNLHDTAIFVCTENTCLAPVHAVDEALKALQW